MCSRSFFLTCIFVSQLDRSSVRVSSLCGKNVSENSIKLQREKVLPFLIKLVGGQTETWHSADTMQCRLKCHGIIPAQGDKFFWMNFSFRCLLHGKCYHVENEMRRGWRKLQRWLVLLPWDSWSGHHCNRCGHHSCCSLCSIKITAMAIFFGHARTWKDDAKRISA